MKIMDTPSPQAIQIDIQKNNIRMKDIFKLQSGPPQ